MVYNVPGIASGQLVLDGPTIADIYLGKIGKWNDPAIKKLNPGVNLPDSAILVVHRSDGSGTTFVFATYLSRVSNDWKTRVGAATSVDWPTGIGAKGNEGVAGNVAQTSGSIGYVEYAYAKQNHLKYSRMVNKEGKTVGATIDTFKAAASNADWSAASHDNFYIILVDQPGEQSWPITATTYILMYKKPVDPATSAAALKFFKWAYANGDDMALASTMCRCRRMPWRRSRPAGSRSRVRECNRYPWMRKTGAEAIPRLFPLRRVACHVAPWPKLSIRIDFDKGSLGPGKVRLLELVARPAPSARRRPG